MASKPKTGALSHLPHAMPLKTLGNVRSELARLYRGCLNGKLPADEMSRLVFALRELRCTIESIEATAQANPLEVTPSVVNLQIIAVAHGAQYDATSGKLTYSDGSVGDPPEFVPATPTPPLTLTYDRPEAFEPCPNGSK